MKSKLSRRDFLKLASAFSLVPLFDAEASLVLDAQRARGIDSHTKNPKGIIRLVRYTLIPMVISALSRVDSLAISMEARGFGYKKKRTFLYRTNFHISDFIIILVH